MVRYVMGCHPTVDYPKYLDKYIKDLDDNKLLFLCENFYTIMFGGKCKIEYNPRALEFRVVIVNDDVRFMMIKLPINLLNTRIFRYIKDTVFNGYESLVGSSQPDEGRWISI